MTAGDLVTLAADFGRFGAGAIGAVVGFYRRSDEEAVVVSFAGEIEAIPAALLAPVPRVAA
jgi:hypothetical protein